ncbi:MAG TPA: hypothetical protein VHE79_04380 [Spirochaetia bacterium]
MCPDRDVLSAWIDGEVSSPWNRVIADHIASCQRCAAEHERLLSVRRALREEPAPDFTASMERVRRRLLAPAPTVVDETPAVWRRHVSLPLPVAVLAAVMLVTLGVAVAIMATRTNMGYVRVTRAPSSGTEYQFTVPYDRVEALLKSVGGGDASIESVMTLPKNMKLTPVGQPRMVRETELARNKP